MGISYYLIKHFGQPLTYAYATPAKCAGNSTFWGIVYCNLGTPKTVISNFVTTRQIETPILPHVPCLWCGGRTSTATKDSKIIRDAAAVALLLLLDFPRCYYPHALPNHDATSSLRNGSWCTHRRWRSRTNDNATTVLALVEWQS
jgi:hypothetical protein